MIQRLFRLVSLVVCSSLFAAVVSAQSGATGAVSGRVIDSSTSRGLPGAKVDVDGLNLSTVTDRDGDFRLPALPVGSQTLIVSYLGRKDARSTVQIKTGELARASITIEPDTTYHESMTVSALIRDAQERALNQQKTALNISNVVSADQIGNFPDPNAAEVISRVPGVSITRDQGEGRYVLIRGTEPRLNSMLINGERIPSPDPDFRQVALDVIPADLLQAVEVSKALTPDMDADAIGGAVNLVTKQGPDRPSLFGTFGGGFNNSLGSYDQRNANVSFGRRFGNAVGLVLGASMNGTERGNQDFEPVYTSGALTDLDLRNYTVVRRRNGGTGALDIHASPTTFFTVRGIYNYFIDDHELRQQLRERVANRRLERVLRDRTHVERIWNLSFAGHQDLGRSTLDYHVQGARSSQFDPGTITTTFRQSNVNFSPNVSADSIDPDNVQANPLNENLSAYTLNSQVHAINSNVDRDIVGGLDFRTLTANRPGLTAFLKVGAKFRDKDKARVRDEETLTPNVTVPLSAVLAGDNSTRSILNGRYDVGPFINALAADNLKDTIAMTSAVNHDRDAEDATTSEQIAAGYVMAELYLGSRLMILPGVRAEHTSASYVGSDVIYSPAHVWLATNPLLGTSNYTTVLPGVQMKYMLNGETNLRAAVTRTLARPNYIDEIPNRVLDDQANTLALGNPNLRPTLAWNGDLMLEHYLKSVGVISAGVFYKSLRDYIYTFTTSEVINGETFTVRQPQNGDSASILGAEITAQSQLSFLPAPFNGIGVYLNYTFTDSAAVFPARPGEDSRLPGQSRHVGNVSVSYEKGGFSGRVALNFHGSFVDAIGAGPGLDRFYDTHKQVDVSFSQRLTRNVRVFFDGLNLTDAPLRYFQGTPDRPLQEEHYQWWAAFGVKVNWTGR